MRQLARLGTVAGIALSICAAAAYAQTTLRARTDTGREVILRGDGTWSFADTLRPQAAPSPTPPAPPTAAPAASPPPAPVTSAVTSPPPVGTPASPPVAATPPAPSASTTPAPPATPASAQRPGAFPPVQRPRDATAVLNLRRGNFRFWYSPAKWRPAPENADGRVQLQLTGQEVYLAIIPDGAPLPIPQLRTLALENARQTGPDARIIAEQTRTIQGREVLLMQMHLTANNTPVAFIGYYYGDPRGSIQVVGYTTQRDLTRFSAQILEALDGLDLNR